MIIDRFDGKCEFLSNFFRCEVWYGGNTYPSVEHAFQAAKTDDPIEKYNIRQAATPGQAKRLGRRATLRTDWEGAKLSVMETCLESKFQDKTLAKWLVETGDAELIEGNNWNDTFWGVCKGVGENHLGKLLMLIRKRLNPPFRPGKRLWVEDDARPPDAETYSQAWLRLFGEPVPEKTLDKVDYGDHFYLLKPGGRILEHSCEGSSIYEVLRP